MLRSIRTTAAAVVLLAIATAAHAQVRDTATRQIRQAVIQSADGAFRMRVFGRLAGQLQYTHPDEDTDIALNGGTYAGRPITGPVSLLRIRRARLGIEGNVGGPNYEYQMQIELAGASAVFKRGYLNWRASGADLQLRGGKFKVPFGRQQLTSFTQLASVDRSLPSDEFAKGDDDGVMVWGQPFGGKLEYDIGAFNGDGQNRYLAQDARNQFAARVVWSPLGKVPLDETLTNAGARRFVTIGAAANLNGGALFDINGVAGIQTPTRTCTSSGCTDNEGDNASVLHTNVELSARYDRIMAAAEYFARRIDPETSGIADVRASGWYAQAAMAVKPHAFDVGARYGELDRDRSRMNDGITEMTFFANRYVRGNDLKLQADYSLIGTGIPASGATLNDHRLRVQFVASF